MNRRTFQVALTGAVASPFATRLFGQEPARFEPSWDSLNKHKVPDWYDDAKLGIFIHWGLYSVPAWAPSSGELGKVDRKRWFIENAYAEWYLNTLRIKESPTYKHHIETYGKDFDYYNFASTFNKETQKWNPDTWASLFHRTGARYVVLTTKHHDGFTLWPSTVKNPKRSEPLAATRDLVGDLTTAVRRAGMKMGLYYSGGLDWTFTSEPIRTVEDLKRLVPQSEEYARYADAHWRELIERYQPSVMWNDISYPKAGQIPQIFAEYYNRVPEGVINNRFGVKFSDFTTPEYAKYSEITAKKWESCRGLGYSFGYNQVEGPEQVIAPDKLIALVIDIVSKNGNLLLNVGPKPDGTISDIQTDRLQKLGDWLAVNGEGIFDTHPWKRASAGEQIRFTIKADALYAFSLVPPQGGSLTIPGLTLSSDASVQMLGGDKVKWQQKSKDLVVDVSGAKSGPNAMGLKISPLPA